MPTWRRAFGAALAVSAGAFSGAFGQADTTPPFLSVQHPWPSSTSTYVAGGPLLPLLVATAGDWVALAGVSWSTDSGGAGTLSEVCPWATYCWWEATEIPLVVGTNTITVTARDVAGNTTSRVLTVVARAAPTTYHVDCSLGVPGDGSMESPFYDLKETVSASAAGDTIQIDGGVCAADFLVRHGLTLQGNPARAHAELDMRGWYMQIDTPESFTLRHVRFVETRPEAWPKSPRVFVDDVHDSTLSAWFVTPEYIVRRSQGIQFRGASSGASIDVDVESSTGLDFWGVCFSGGVVRMRARDSVFNRVAICDHGHYDIEIERSRIEAGTFEIAQYREGGCCEFHVAVRDSEIVRTRLMINRYSGGSCPGPYPCPIPRGTALFEGNRFVDSTLVVRTSNQGSVPAPQLADLTVQNNLFERSGMAVELELTHADWVSTFAALVRHNTFVDAPAALDLRATIVDSPPPVWAGELANNIFSGCEVGLRVEATGSGTVDTRIAANDFHGNALDIDVDSGATLQGNLFAPPRFKDPAAGDYSLLPGSVCIDAGADVLEPPSQDILGRPRELDGDKDGVARPDIGAWEFVRGRLHRLKRRSAGGLSGD